MKGATPERLYLANPYRHFNPRTHEGCDFINAHETVPVVRHFNPRTHEGCDSLQINSVIACFSIIYIAN